MISKKLIKDLEKENINDFYNYIVESKINGNYTQTKEFIKKLSKTQRKDFFIYCENEKEIYKNVVDFTEVQNMILEVL